jgi:hypothetical protein
MQVHRYQSLSVTFHQIMGRIYMENIESEWNLLTYTIICPVSDAGVQIPVAICNASSDYRQNLHGECQSFRLRLELVLTGALHAHYFSLFVAYLISC